MAQSSSFWEYYLKGELAGCAGVGSKMGEREEVLRKAQRFCVVITVPILLINRY